MMNKPPSVVPAPDSDQHPNEPGNSEFLFTRPKAAFLWPPDCVWPFMDRKRDSES
jgi:hypothetical protein